jgi:hypothetical protein
MNPAKDFQAKSQADSLGLCKLLTAVTFSELGTLFTSSSASVLVLASVRFRRIGLRPCALQGAALCGISVVTVLASVETLLRPRIF